MQHAPTVSHARACQGHSCVHVCAQALSNRQQKKPGKLFAPGSSRAGFSIFVRALSKDPVEAQWLQRFVDLATSEPREHNCVVSTMLAVHCKTPLQIEAVWEPV